jgi:hypothetical protein
MIKLLLASGFLALLTVSCSSACESAGRKEFQKQHPDYTILETSPDGNDKSVTYIVRFKKPKDDKVYYAYISTEDNKTQKCEVSIREF